MESAALGRPFTRDGWSSRFEFASRFDAADGAGASDDVVSARTKKVTIMTWFVEMRYSDKSRVVCRRNVARGSHIPLRNFIK